MRRRLRATLGFHAYCGMTFPIDDTGFRADVGDLRSQAARRLRQARRAGRVVTTVRRGERWEFQTPDDAVMVSDSDGILSLSVPDEGMEGDDEEPEDQEDLAFPDDEPEEEEDEDDGQVGS